jgi:hypothetical protein
VLFAVLAAFLLVAGAVLLRSFSGDGASAVALPDACQNLAVVTANPSTLSDEAFMLGTLDNDAMDRLQRACRSNPRF